MSELVRDYIDLRSGAIEATLHRCLPVSELACGDALNRAIEYAVFPGGRRMRPILTLLAAEVCGGAAEEALRAGCAVEFLHAASLTIDDMPAMDDAGLRRGRPAVHVLFGADVAMLTALALLNESYGLFAEVAGLLPSAVREIGVNGMIGGQAVDIAGAASWTRMEKTTALTRLTMAAGAATAQAGPADTGVLTSFGQALGEAYQICDDLADVFSTDAELGKTARQDQRHGRGSAVELLGRDEAQDHAGILVERACRELRERFGRSHHAQVLEAFARSVVAQNFAQAK